MSEPDNVDPRFLAWWKSNWPDLAPTHQALHAWLAAWEMLDKRIVKGKAILEEFFLMHPTETSYADIHLSPVAKKDIRRALEALEGK